MIEFANRANISDSTGSRPEPVVHPVDRLLGEVLVDRSVQRLRGSQVVAERLLHHDPRLRGQPDPGDPLGDPAEEERRHLQVEQDPLGVAERVRHRTGRSAWSPRSPSTYCSRSSSLAAAGAVGSMLFSFSEAAA